MNDLISRSELLESFKKSYCGHLGMENSDGMMTFRSICRIIKEQPTAYSVDKVVEELKEKENEQLAEWSEELKKYKSYKPVDKEFYKAGYTKAIDDFAEKATKIVYEANDRDRNPQPRDMVADIHYKLIELAEQLKEGSADNE